jgi:hypothetical protein
MNTLNQIWEFYFPYYIASTIIVNLVIIGLQLTVYRYKKNSERLQLLIFGAIMGSIPIFNTILALATAVVGVHQIILSIKLKFKK